MKEFFELLRYDASDIQMKFSRSSIEGKGTSQEVSDFREHAVQSFVQKYYSFPYRISKGGIYDSNGQRSDSIDCLILNPNHPNTVDSNGKHSLIIADGVDVAIEVKPDIANKHELIRGLIQGLSVKKLNRFDTMFNEKTTGKELVEHSKKIPYFIFTMKAKNNFYDSLKEIVQYYLENNVRKNEQLDVIVIFNKGIIANYKYKDTYRWSINNHPDEVKEGWFYEEWGEDTLAGFLFHLNRVYPAEMRISRPPLTNYFTSKKINVTPIAYAFN
ncbi:DUF6602 domain-containing protein [Oceanobacillus rekensis]|uniref:DUF6602 domain-containing protein n=1 Tax=Oceanobacillus rekensis TaxID=937927 RepID=UPI000B442FC1|nr:DUF6602 domain-containing protein [Oceanobacillus rekensis]